MIIMTPLLSKKLKETAYANGNNMYITKKNLRGRC